MIAWKLFYSMIPILILIFLSTWKQIHLLIASLQQPHWTQWVHLVVPQICKVSSSLCSPHCLPGPTTHIRVLAGSDAPNTILLFHLSHASFALLSKLLKAYLLTQLLEQVMLQTCDSWQQKKRSLYLCRSAIAKHVWCPRNNWGGMRPIKGCIRASWA